MAANSPQACTDGFTAALVRHDMDAALSFLTDDVVFFYSHGSAIVGEDAFTRLYLNPGGHLVRTVHRFSS